MIDLKKYTELAMRTAPKPENFDDMSKRAHEARVYEAIEDAMEALYRLEKMKKFVNKGKAYKAGRPPQLDRTKMMDPKNILSLYAVMGLAGELSEVMVCLFGKDEVDEPLSAEVGDIMFYLALLSKDNQFALADSCEGNVRKLEKRYDLAPSGLENDA